MDKARFKARLMELVRETFSFEGTARVTLLMSVRLDDQPDSLNVEVSEELLAKPGRSCSAAPAGPAVSSAVSGGGGGSGGSKRKSQAPQRMVPSGEEDYFVPAPAAAGTSRDASSSFGADLSTAAVATEDEEPQPLNLSRHGSPSVGAGGSSSTPLKPVPTAAAAAFQLNNPDLAFYPYMGAAVHPAAKPPAMFGATHPLPALAPNGLQQQPQQPQQPQQQPQPQQKQQKQPHSRPAGVRSRRPGNRTFPCNQCGIVFQSLAGLSKHTFTMHKVYKCTFCGANFTQRSNLQRHSLKHVGFKPFECRCCRKSYYRKDHLVRHIEVTHPGFDPKMSIDTRLSSAECLQYLERKHESRDYTCLSGVVLSAASAAAAAGSESGVPDETLATAGSESGVPTAASAAAAAAASGTEDEIDETEELLMMDDEFDEADADAEFEEPMDEAGVVAEEDDEIDAEIDVGSEEPQPILLEQPVAE